MDEVRLTRAAIRDGVWRGELEATGEAPPQIAVTHRGETLRGVGLEDAGEGRYLLNVPIPVELLSDGVQTFVITDTANDTRLGSFAIVAGRPADDDLLAEVALLREELDMLKSAFRRHCLETA